MNNCLTFEEGSRQYSTINFRPANSHIGVPRRWERKVSKRPFAWENTYPETLRWDARIEIGSVCSLLEAAAAECPQQIALHFRERRISYADWQHRVDRLAAALLKSGLAPQQGIAILMPNTPHLLIAFFGCLKAGARVVFLSPLDAPRVLSHKLADSGARTLVTTNIGGMLASATALLDAGLADRVIVADDAHFGGDLDREAIPRRKVLITLDRFLGNDRTPVEWPAVGADDVALLQYTGGTTGLPKAAILTHGNLTAAASSFDHWFESVHAGHGVPERVLCVLPLFHIYALSAVMLLCIKRRAELVLHMRFDAGQVLSELEKKQITSFPGVPTMWIALASHPDFANRDLSRLRRCSSGGAPLPVEVGRRLEKIMGRRLVGGWGMTETSSAGTALLPHGTPKPDSIGIPLPGIDVQVVSLDDPKELLDAGEIGELRISGKNVTSGYWNRPDETSSAFVDGYLLTGDIGYMARDGHFYIVDRKKDLIISSGFNIYPQMIEQAIYEHPSVAECVVIGVSDAYRGESAKAFVVLSSDAGKFSLDQLRDFLADKLGNHELPRALEFRKELPKTPAGKLSRKELHDEEQTKARTTGEHGDAGPVATG